MSGLEHEQGSSVGFVRHIDTWFVDHWSYWSGHGSIAAQSVYLSITLHIAELCYLNYFMFLVLEYTSFLCLLIKLLLKLKLIETRALLCNEKDTECLSNPQ